MAWRYLAQNIVTGAWIHRDLPLSSVQLTPSVLSGPTGITATLQPERAAIDGTPPVLDEWSTAIYAEESGLIRCGAILIDSDTSGPQWQLTCSGFSGYPSGIPYEAAASYVKTNYDPLNVVRDLWAYVQGQAGGNIGMVVDSTTSTAKVGVTKDTSGQVLDVPGQSKKVGQSLEQWPANSGDNQLWKLIDQGNGYSTIKNKNSALNLGVAYGSTASGAPAIQFTPDGHTSQNWKTVDHGDTVAIVNQNSGQCLDVSGSSTIKGAPVVQTPYTGKDSQHWIISDPDTDGYSTITNYNTGVTTPYELDWWNSTDLGDEINTLAQSTPFDYWEQHTWTDDSKQTVTHRLRLGFPRAGARKAQLRFSDQENISQVVTVQRHGENYANTVVALGAGSGSSMLRATATANDSRPRRVAIIQDASITEQSTLDSLARSELNSRLILPEVTSFVIRDHPNAHLGSFLAGDDILLNVAYGWDRISVWHRVTSYTVQPDDPTWMTVSCMRSDRFRYVGGLTGSAADGG